MMYFAIGLMILLGALVVASTVITMYWRKDAFDDVESLVLTIFLSVMGSIALALSWPVSIPAVCIVGGGYFLGTHLAKNMEVK